MLSFFSGTSRKDREEEKLLTIYEEYRSRMISTARAILPTQQLAEDAIQDALIALMRNLHKMNEVLCHETEGYVVITVKNCALNLLKKQHRHREVFFDDSNIESTDTASNILESLNAEEAFQELVKVIKALPDALSDAFMLSAVHGFSIEEIAEELQISNDAVRKRLSRARKQLSNSIAQKETHYNGKN